MKSLQHILPKATASLAVCGLVLAGCSSSEGADYILSLPQDVQQQAYEDCIGTMSLSASRVQIQRLDFDDGRVSLFAINGNGVSLAQARSLNQCARARLLSGQTQVAAAAPTSTPATYQAAQPTTIITGGTATSAGCRPGYGVMQRGIYCVGY